ncbi:MAG: hypothetical protein GEU73_11630 [Chloroflexi bacterium]|nr:hypothetical protein [Chloroflexota bacterium]
MVGCEGSYPSSAHTATILSRGPEAPGACVILAMVPAWSTGAPMRNLTTWQALVIASELGIAFAIAVLAGVFLGNVADERLGHDVPILTVAGAFIGLAVAVFSSIQLVQLMTRPRKE